MTKLTVNGKMVEVSAESQTPLLYVLRNELGLKGPKFGCGLEQCNSCKVLIDGADLPSCKVPIEHVEGLEITTIEGLGSAENLHPLQEAFIEEQAIQCGYCVSGMIIAAQGLLNRTRYPTDDDINTALEGNLCRCGVHERVRRAIKMRIGQPVWEPIYEVIDAPPLTVAPSPQDKLPTSIAAFPDLDSWVRVDGDAETVTIFSGKVEIGQGIKTAAMQISAEELDVDFSRIRIVTADTARTPDEGVTAGSMSVETTGHALRFAAADARQYLLDLAFEALESQTPAEQLLVKDGVVSDPATGREVSYWQLHGGKRFGRKITGNAPLKNPAEYTIVGQSEKRADLVAKVTGQPSYIHDIELPNMLHGRLVRPPRYGAKLVQVDEATVAAMRGVTVVRDGSFLGVLAEDEAQAVVAAAILAEKAEWDDSAELRIVSDLRTENKQSHLIVKGVPQTGNIPAINPPKQAAKTISASYTRPYHMHGSLSPSAAVAQWDGGKLTVYSHSQGVFRLRTSIAATLGIAEDDIHLIHAEAAGCYGHNGADDAAFDAALLAQHANDRPVSLKWMREDEHRWEPYGAAMALDLQASLDADGNIIDWNHDVYSYPHLGRPMPSETHSNFISAWHRENALPKPTAKANMHPEVGGHRNATPAYAFENQRVVRHFLADSPLRTSSLRTLGAYGNVFAIESFMDELAVEAGVDPVDFRLRHMTNERARAVIEAAAKKANWQSRSTLAGNGVGRGIAYAQYKNKQCYTAVVVEVEVAEQIQVKRVVISAESGQIVNPDGLSNQLEGGALQALSWTLFEQVKWNAQGITSCDWDEYPILRFPDAPVMETVLLNRPNHPFLGVGEATQGPTAAALANAIFDATGERLRAIPFGVQLKKHDTKTEEPK